MTYNDLLIEKRRLKVLQHDQLIAVKREYRELREELEPVKKVISFIRRLTTRENNSLVQAGVNVATDLVFKNFILSKAGWISKLVVPYLIKNYSSHLTKDTNAAGVLQRIIGMFKAK
jgi:hypothetical protein